MNKTLLFVSLLLATICSGIAIVEAWFGLESATSSEKPNIVVVLTDDMRKDDMQFAPRTKALVGDEGIRFSGAFVNYAMCCPSRATILTGNYPHNTGVLDNTPRKLPAGGASAFEPNEATALPTWLQASGYQTALMGKYFNGYSGDHVPPGWNEWLASVDNGKYATKDGGIASTNIHDTDYLTKKADEYIRSRSGAAPFFLYLAPEAPHPPAIPPNRYKDEYKGLQVPRSDPAYDEANVSDKPRFIRKLDHLSAAQKEEMDVLYRNRARSMLALDNMVEQVVGALKDTGQLDNTYIVFFSDNGFHQGEHRLLSRKTTAYEEDIRVPLMVRGPGITAGQTRDQMVLNNDLAPTFAEWASASAPYTPDGRSLTPLLADTPSVLWRSAFLIEKYGDHVTPGPYKAVRTEGRILIRHANASDELYNFRSDPRELENVFGRVDPATVNNLNARLNALKDCSGLGCRTAEGP